MIRKFLTFWASVLTAITLCGCSFFASDTAELLSPPALTGELNPISTALSRSVKEEYTLKYPSRGDYRSAIVREDIDGDGILEAFAFYATTGAESVNMNLNYIRLKDGEWKSAAVQSLAAGGVDMLEFCDLDGDGIKELLVGWEIYGTSEMQLAVYNLAENSLTQRMLQRYTHFTTCDLSENDKNEILIINVNTAENRNTAALYELLPDGVAELSDCELDNAAKTFNMPVVSTLSSGKPAVYIDEVKGIGAVTEVLFMEKGELVNPLFAPDTKETLATLRSASFALEDINDDGIPEIPVQRDVPSVTKLQLNEKLYLTEWCSFNGERLTVRLTTMINANDGYYYTVPPKWVDNIAVLKDTDSRVREIYRYDPKTSAVGESLLYFVTVKKADLDAGKYDLQGAAEIISDGENTVLCRISEAAIRDGVTAEAVKAACQLYEQE